MARAARSRAAASPARQDPAVARPSSPLPARRRPAAVPRHFLSLDGAATVPTPDLQAVREGLEQAAAAQAMLCVHGDTGCGKTFAVHTQLAAGPPNGYRVLHLTPRPAPTPVAVRAELHHALALPGTPPSDPGVADAALRRALAACPHLLVVDEAQRLPAACFEHLRHLFDDPHTQLAIVWIAGTGGLTVLRRQRMLASRTAAWLHLPPLTGTQVRTLIPCFHPLWRHTDTSTLDLLNSRFCHGNFRRWAAATHHARRLAGRTGRACSPPADSPGRRPVLDDLLTAHLTPTGEGT